MNARAAHGVRSSTDPACSHSIQRARAARGARLRLLCARCARKVSTLRSCCAPRSRVPSAYADQVCACMCASTRPCVSRSRVNAAARAPSIISK
eukprot:7481-Pleurochrysis_carterae.AAC.1